MTSANSSILKGEADAFLTRLNVASNRPNDRPRMAGLGRLAKDGVLHGYAAAAIVRLKALAPYALIELVLPGGSVMALLLWLYRRRKNAVGLGQFPVRLLSLLRLADPLRLNAVARSAVDSMSASGAFRSFKQSGVCVLGRLVTTACGWCPSVTPG
jgi:hypothetical protein